MKPNETMKYRNCSEFQLPGKNIKSQLNCGILVQTFSFPPFLKFKPL